MAFCPNCGAEVKEGAAFCPSCGAPVNKAAEPTPAPQPQPQAAPAYTAPQPQYQAPYQAPVQQKASGQLNTGMLVFSIINIFFCTIFGIIALIMTITAKDKPTAEEEQKALKTAKTLNIIGIIFGILSIVLYVIIGIIVPIAMGGAYAWALS